MARDSSTAHWLSRLEDRLHGMRQRRGLRRGLVPTVIPFTGYGTTGWVRVLGRVVLRKPGTPPTDRAASFRGRRSFVSIPVSGAPVDVVVDGTRSTIRSDRGGVLDAAISAELAPGWTQISLGMAGDEVEAPVFVVDDGVNFGIVSDVDDTVMVTTLPRPLLAAWNTFVVNE